MEELLVIVGAELILLVSIVVMTIHQRRADVLTRGGFNEGDYAFSERRTERPWLRIACVRDALRRRTLLAREQTARKIPASPQQSHRPVVPVSFDADHLEHSPGSRAQYVEQMTSSIDNRRDASAAGHRVPASLPHGVRIYAIGDIHGRSDLLSKLLACIEADCQQRPVERAITVFVGDYIDRGPQSRDVIDLLLRWRESNDAVFLRGNHETFLPRFLSDPKTLDDWRQCGGLETLLSYGLQPTINPNRDEQERLADQLAYSLPKEHHDFLESLDPFYSCGDFFFVHAGIRPGVPIDQQVEEDLLWIREEFLAWEQPFEQFVVHGHTPVEATDLRSNRINIDTGAFATGRLTCIAIDGCDITQLTPASLQADVFSAPLTRAQPDPATAS
jgi:diadenosine tetraphosphatase ApaH/serine/threonine PP2A family protein phosphatase